MSQSHPWGVRRSALDGLRRPLREHLAEHLGLEPAVVLPSHLGAEADLVPDPPLDPLAAVGADAPDGDVVDQHRLVLVLGLERLVHVGGAGLEGRRVLGDEHGGAQPMLQGIGAGDGLPLGRPRPGGELGIPPVGGQSDFGADHGRLARMMSEEWDRVPFITFIRRGREQSHLFGDLSVRGDESRLE